MHIWRWLAVSAVAITLAAAGYGAVLMFDCDDTVIREVPSPDGRYIAALFERDCGATTDFARHVAVRSKGQQFSGDRDDQRVLVIRGRKEINLRWTSPTELEIDRKNVEASDVFLERQGVSDVRITYSNRGAPNH